MTWGIQILIEDKWRWMHPTRGDRYEYPLHMDAEIMLNICYPDQIREYKLGGKQTVRIMEITGENDDTYS